MSARSLLASLVVALSAGALVPGAQAGLVTRGDFTFIQGEDGLLYTTYEFNMGADLAIDIAVLGDGYTEAEAADFIKSAEGLIDQLWNVAPYGKYRCRFNVWFVLPIASASGVSSASPLQVTIGSSTGGYGYVVANAERCKQACEQAEVPGFDVTVVIANSSGYGAWYVGNIACVTREYAMGALLGHELGHILADLGEEYDFYYNDSRDNARSYSGGDPDYANVSKYGTAASESLIKWRDRIPDWVIDNHLLPSDDMKSCVCGTVGAWKGAGTYEQLYRPSEYCLMRRVCDITPLCEVCEDAVGAALRLPLGPDYLTCGAEVFLFSEWGGDIAAFMKEVQRANVIAVLAKRLQQLVVPPRPEPPVLVTFDVPSCFDCLPVPVPEVAADPVAQEIRVELGGVTAARAWLIVIDDTGAVAAPASPLTGGRGSLEFTGSRARRYRAALLMYDASRIKFDLETSIYRDGVSVLP